MRGRDAGYMSANMCEYSDYTCTMIGAGRRDALNSGAADKAAARELERALSVASGDGRPATGRYV
jgi:hypothetical protein